MQQTSLSPADFPLSFSRMVAEAAMTLPPLTRPQDSAFLLRMTEVVIDAFWQNYVNHFSPEVRSAFISACNEGPAQYLSWMSEYADFKSNRSACDIGSEILEEIAGKLPAIMQHEYPLFTLDDAETL